MEYELNLCTASDKQLDHLRVNTSHIYIFTDDLHPEMTTTEWWVKHAFRKNNDV